MYIFFHWMQYLWNSLSIWQDQNTLTFTVWVPPSTYTQTYKLSVQLSKYICTTIQNIFFSLCFFFLFQISCLILSATCTISELNKIYMYIKKDFSLLRTALIHVLSCTKRGEVCWIRILLLLKSVYLYYKLHTFTVKIFPQAEN